MYAVLVLAVMIGIGGWWLSQLLQPTTPDLKADAATTATQACGLPAAEAVTSDTTLTLAGDNLKGATVTVGQTVRWINATDHEIALRSVTAGHRLVCAGFDSRVLSPQDDFRFTFLRPGDWYFQANNGTVGHIHVSP
jgi:plastocyanin